MKITFLGATQTVIGSKYLLSFDDKEIFKRLRNDTIELNCTVFKHTFKARIICITSYAARRGRVLFFSLTFIKGPPFINFGKGRV